MKETRLKGALLYDSIYVKFYNIQTSLDSLDRKQINGFLGSRGLGGAGRGLQRLKETFVDNMFIMLIVVMFSQVYTYVKSYHVQLILCLLYLN